MVAMPIELDPAGREPLAILNAAEFRGARVLELGCGDGRLTSRYAEAAGSVFGIDTNEQEIRSAMSLPGNTRLLCASGTALPFCAKEFDIVLFASSL
jgi:ubiquinone/menaquinone biosynthesis C-methylase UbiE